MSKPKTRRIIKLNTDICPLMELDDKAKQTTKLIVKGCLVRRNRSSEIDKPTYFLCC